MVPHQWRMLFSRASPEVAKGRSATQAPMKKSPSIKYFLRGGRSTSAPFFLS